ncbi:MAG TPA: bifunctional DNA-formamidopyrimidine glycosylase/DNA-(apurinic or apyrimidinic site) lyase [Thermoleophilaceae bacterium]|nr:bifunctional DNA-formamidopyrimidine glycosylase/DNA-(apurinic or apyrimidinic site) lyase [Thermoleophilaceae bacterium]
MPELPEVETIRRVLAPRVEGRVLERLEVLDHRFSAPAPPEELEDAASGRRIERLTRRGKYLVWELAPLDAERDARARDGHAPQASEPLHLVMHLRMTGNLLLGGPVEAARPPHLRVRFVLGSGETILFTDPRRFGTGVALRGDAALEEHLASRVGIEPLDPAFTPDALLELAHGRRAPVKAFLLSQERIAGVGNIYADEALFRAGIHPERPVGTLRRRQLAVLRNAVVESLEAGIDARGATIDDFRQPDGARGSFQDRFLVHRRAGDACPRCGREIVKLRVAQRGTYVCERCQPRPRRRGTSARRIAAK